MYTDFKLTLKKSLLLLIASENEFQNSTKNPFNNSYKFLRQNSICSTHFIFHLFFLFFLLLPFLMSFFFFHFNKFSWYHSRKQSILAKGKLFFMSTSFFSQSIENLIHSCIPSSFHSSLFLG